MDLAIDAFYSCVLRWLSWLDEMQVYIGLLRSGEQRLARAFRAIIQDDILWHRPSPLRLLSRYASTRD